MNQTKKQKLANRTAYAILALLLIAVVTVTVIAIVATVSKRNEELPPQDEQLPDGSDQPSDGESGSENTPPPNDENSNQSPSEPQEPTPSSPVFVLPANGNVSKDYSLDALVFSSTMNDYRVHLGVDISGAIGDPVYSFSEGTVKEISDHPFMGKTVIISHAGGLESKYMNLANELPEGIKVGAAVSVGTVIGAIGETALAECADDPHLHFEVWLNGKQVSPSGYVTFNKEQ